MWINPAKSFRLMVALVVAAVVAKFAIACDTPVYRYAMYKWRPAPYEIYFFHTAETAGEGAPVQQAVEKLKDDPVNQTNVVYIPVNLDEDKELTGVPADVKQAWQKREDKTTPHYMVVSPVGAQVYNGSLTKDDVANAVNSKARQAIAKDLQAGKVGVFVVLTGSHEKQNAQAESVLNDFAKDVASGKLDLQPKPIDDFSQFGEKPITPAETPTESEDKVKEMKQEIGIVRVDRKDMKEQWLVRQLLEVEPDLKDTEFASQPMIFVVLGRGRALPPFIGKGITKVNLTDVVHFVSGPCSCTVQEQNPGVNLLFSYDWESASADLAEKFGSEEGNEKVFGADEFFPDLIIGSGSPDELKTPEDNGATGTQSDDPRAKTETAEPKSNDASTKPPKGPPSLKNGKPRSADGQVASASKPSRPVETPTTGASDSSVMPLVIGIGIAFIVLFGLTLVVLKPR